MQITVTGGTGFIGRALVERLLGDGHTVRITARRRPPTLDPRVMFWTWDVLTTDPPAEALEAADAVIHLAGEPIAQRWTPLAKARIRGSRWEGTRRLVNTIARFQAAPRTLVCASAIGIYGDRGEQWLTETSPPGTGFLAEVVEGWEREARAAEQLGTRVVLLRTGMVLGRGGGVLARLVPVFRRGLGGRLGSGRQFTSWIHIEDLIELIVFALGEDKVSGPLNAVAPSPVTNREFTSALARALRRPALFRVPAFILRMALGEMASVLLDSQRVRPEAALRAGFCFRWPQLAPALANLLA